MGTNVTKSRINQSASGFSGNSQVSLAWFGNKLSERLIALLIEEMTPIFYKMQALAEKLCPVGQYGESGIRMSPISSRPAYTFKKRTNGREYNRKITTKTGIKIPKRDYKNAVPKTVGMRHQARESGRLRNSIRGSVAARHDKTAVLGFLEAGDDNAFYAAMVEFGTSMGAAPHPYMRPAWNQYKDAALEAIDRAVYRLSTED